MNPYNKSLTVNALAISTTSPDEKIMAVAGWKYASVSVCDWPESRNFILFEFYGSDGRITSVPKSFATGTGNCVKMRQSSIFSNSLESHVNIILNYDNPSSGFDFVSISKTDYEIKTRNVALEGDGLSMDGNFHAISNGPTTGSFMAAGFLDSSSVWSENSIAILKI